MIVVVNNESSRSLMVSAGDSVIHARVLFVSCRDQGFAREESSLADFVAVGVVLRWRSWRLWSFRGPLPEIFRVAEDFSV